MYETITINIMVTNVKETLAFYESTLGFKKIISVPEDGEILKFAILSKDKISIMLQSQESMEEEYPTLETQNINPTFTLFITVENVKELYEQLIGKVKIAKEINNTFYGKEEFAIFDNNGNILTLSC